MDEPVRPNPRSGKRSKSGKRSRPVEYPSDNLVEPLSAMPEFKDKKTPKSGYYVLNAESESSSPKYVYYGPKPPGGSVGEE